MIKNISTKLNDTEQQLLDDAMRLTGLPISDVIRAGLRNLVYDLRLRRSGSRAGWDMLQSAKNENLTTVDPYPNL